jgi:hypothetical protein
MTRRVCEGAYVFDVFQKFFFVVASLETYCHDFFFIRLIVSAIVTRQNSALDIEAIGMPDGRSSVPPVLK